MAEEDVVPVTERSATQTIGEKIGVKIVCRIAPTKAALLTGRPARGLITTTSQSALDQQTTRTSAIL